MANSLKEYDVASMQVAEDLTAIDHYRIGVRSTGTWGKLKFYNTDSLRYLTVGEINPYVDDLLYDDLAKYQTPDEAESDRERFVATNMAIGLLTNAVVVGVNASGVVLAIDGQYLKPKVADDSD